MREKREVRGERRNARSDNLLRMSIPGACAVRLFPAIAIASLTAAAAIAQTYPTRAPRLVVPYVAGGIADFMNSTDLLPVRPAALNASPKAAMNCLETSAVVMTTFWMEELTCDAAADAIGPQNNE